MGAPSSPRRSRCTAWPIVAGRTVGLDRVDPTLAREMFVRRALVDGEWDAPHAFLRHNEQFRRDVAALEDRARRGGLLDDDQVHDFYDDRVPDDVVSTRQFDRWWRDARGADPTQLDLTAAVLRTTDGVAISFSDFPDTWTVSDDLSLPLRYRFEPGQPLDGVTVTIPLLALNQVPDDGFDWHVPGFRRELATALARTLPKELRRALIPATDTVAAAFERVGPPHGRFVDALADGTVGRGRGRDRGRRLRTRGTRRPPPPPSRRGRRVGRGARCGRRHRSDPPTSGHRDPPGDRRRRAAARAAGARHVGRRHAPADRHHHVRGRARSRLSGVARRRRQRVAAHPHQRRPATPRHARWRASAAAARRCRADGSVTGAAVERRPAGARRGVHHGGRTGDRVRRDRHRRRPRRARPALGRRRLRRLASGRGRAGRRHGEPLPAHRGRRAAWRRGGCARCSPAWSPRPCGRR